MVNRSKDNEYNMHHSHHIFGTVKVGERGQIVTPKEAREMFGINSGDLLMIMGIESKGLFIVQADGMKKMAIAILEKSDKIEE